MSVLYFFKSIKFVAVSTAYYGLFLFLNKCPYNLA